MTTILIVDDSKVDQRLAGALLQAGLGLDALYAADGGEALKVIAEHKPALVLTDMAMPQMDGLELVAAIRQRYPEIPVVLMTAHGSEELAAAALREGAASYVPKRNLAKDLAPTVRRMLEIAKSQTEQESAIRCLQSSEVSFLIDNDSDLVQPVISLLRHDIERLHLCDATVMTRVCVALDEALSNAIFHGNLNVSSDLRESGLAAYFGLARDRRGMDPYRQRKVHVSATLSHEQAVFVIRDEGAGFDPASIADPTDAANLEKISGRGLLLIRTFMDEVRHNAKGNEITMIKRQDRR